MHIPDGFIDGPTSLLAGLVAIAGVALCLKRTAADAGGSRDPRGRAGCGVRLRRPNAQLPGRQRHQRPPDRRRAGGGARRTVAGALAVTVVLAVQALLFADGGLSALGLNVVNMALAGAFVGYAVFLAPPHAGTALGRCRRLRHRRVHRAADGGALFVARVRRRRQRRGVGRLRGGGDARRARADRGRGGGHHRARRRRRDGDAPRPRLRRRARAGDHPAPRGGHVVRALDVGVGIVVGGAAVVVLVVLAPPPTRTRTGWRRWPPTTASTPRRRTATRRQAVRRLRGRRRRQRVVGTWIAGLVGVVATFAVCAGLVWPCAARRNPAARAGGRPRLTWAVRHRHLLLHHEGPLHRLPAAVQAGGDPAVRRRRRRHAEGAVLGVRRARPD